MVRQSCLRDRTVPVIADTSVVINLNATQGAETILNALPNPFLVVSEVMLELESGLQTGRNDAASAGRVACFAASASGTAWRHWDNGISSTSFPAPRLKPSMTGKPQRSRLRWKPNPLPYPS